MASQSFPLTPVTKIQGWHRGDLGIDQPHLETLEAPEIVTSLVRISKAPYYPKFSHTASRMLPKMFKMAPKMDPKSDPKTKKLDV